MNRRTSATHADGATTSYTYDKGNRLTQINDSVAGLITRTYDNLNRLTSETTSQGTVGYTYDKASRRETMTVAGQALISYTYDDANRLTRITQGSSIIQFGYDASNRRTSLRLSNGILVEYSFDVSSRVTGVTYKQNGTTMIGDITYEYDKAGNRTRIGGSWARTGLPEPVTATSYDANNRQLTFGNKTLSYDDNGNIQSITDSNGTTLYSWDARNQLVAINGPTVNASFVYDSLGRRAKKIVNGTPTEFLYDGFNPVQEIANATIVANILSGLSFDEFFLRTDVVAGTTSHFLTDVLGSPIRITDNTGAVQSEYTYDAFGKTTSSGAPNSSSYQYTGRENDGTGVYYFRARYYHPELQRFISEDPEGFAGGDLNLFSYVHNSPSNFIDPLGLQAVIPLQPFAPPGQLPKNPLSPSQWRDLTDFFRDLLNSSARAIPGMWGQHLTPEQAAEKQREYEAYKARCNQQVPGPFPNECAKAKWELERARDCFNRLVDWELKWDTYHVKATIERRNAVRNAEDRVRAACKCPTP